jgi:hypothetical protein
MQNKIKPEELLTVALQPRDQSTNELSSKRNTTKVKVNTEQKEFTFAIQKNERTNLGST